MVGAQEAGVIRRVKVCITCLQCAAMNCTSWTSKLLTVGLWLCIESSCVSDFGDVYSMGAVMTVVGQLLLARGKHRQIPVNDPGGWGVRRSGIFKFLTACRRTSGDMLEVT